LAHTRADIYRAALEGIAFATNHIFETYAEVGAQPSTIIAVGGGLRNRIWTQATSDVSGLRQEVREVSIGASYGDAFLARLAVGDVSKAAINQWNPAAFAIEPDPRNARVYESRYAAFRELYPRIRDLMKELGAGSETVVSGTHRSPAPDSNSLHQTADFDLLGKGLPQIRRC
jgi:xylulokinase